MNKKVFNKLVRDKIPEIIKSNCEKPYTRVLTDEEMMKELCKKLQEETSEFLQSEEISELCDIVEVVHALLDLKGCPKDRFKKMLNKKADERGRFKNKIFLEYSEE